METSDVRLVRNSRRDYCCDWCGETILKGEARRTWFCYDERVQADLHPECYDAMCRQNAYYEELIHQHRRGCWCDGDYGECLCRTHRQTRRVLIEGWSGWAHAEKPPQPPLEGKETICRVEIDDSYPRNSFWTYYEPLTQEGITPAGLRGRLFPYDSEDLPVVMFDSEVEAFFPVEAVRKITLHCVTAPDAEHEWWVTEETMKAYGLESYRSREVLEIVPCDVFLGNSYRYKTKES